MKFAALALALAACGGNDMTTQPDAAGSGSGSNTNTVTTVSCTGATVAATVSTVDGTLHYNYSTTTAPTITTGQIVEFKTSATHDVNPSTTGGAHSDPGLKVGFSADVCLKFAAAGTFTFFCSIHGFTGTVTVN